MVCTKFRVCDSLTPGLKWINGVDYPLCCGIIFISLIYPITPTEFL